MVFALEQFKPKLGPVKLHAASIKAIALGPAARLIATADDFGFVDISSVATGQTLLHVLPQTALLSVPVATATTATANGAAAAPANTQQTQPAAARQPAVIASSPSVAPALSPATTVVSPSVAPAASISTIAAQAPAAARPPPPQPAPASLRVSAGAAATAIAFLDASTLVAACKDGKLHFVNIARGVAIAACKLAAGGCVSLALSNDADPINTIVVTPPQPVQQQPQQPAASKGGKASKEDKKASKDDTTKAAMPAPAATQPTTTAAATVASVPNAPPAAVAAQPTVAAAAAAATPPTAAAVTPAVAAATSTSATVATANYTGAAKPATQQPQKLFVKLCEVTDVKRGIRTIVLEPGPVRIVDGNAAAARRLLTPKYMQTAESKEPLQDNGEMDKLRRRVQELEAENAKLKSSKTCCCC
jgi:hypothetical protein